MQPRCLRRAKRFYKPQHLMRISTSSHSKVVCRKIIPGLAPFIAPRAGPTRVLSPSTRTVPGTWEMDPTHCNEVNLAVQPS